MFKQPELTSEIANENHTSVVKQLERLNTYAHSDNKSVRDTFTTLWISDLENHTDINSKFYYTYDPYNRMLFEENLFLLIQTLEVFGITKDLISQLSILEILQIKESEEFHRFITTYRRLVNASYCRQNEIVDRLKKTLTRERVSA